MKKYTVTMNIKAEGARMSLTLDLTAFNRRDAMTQAKEIIVRRFGHNALLTAHIKGESHAY